MISKPDKRKLRLKRHKRMSWKISGTAESIRLSVFPFKQKHLRSIIDDVEGVTLTKVPQQMIKIFQQKVLKWNKLLK